MLARLGIAIPLCWTPVARERPGDADEIGAWVRREVLRPATAGADRNSKAYQAGSGPADRVFAPLSAAIGEREKLFIVPDGDLYLVAFDALPLGKRGLVIDSHEICYLGSGRDAIRLASPNTASLAPPCFDACDRTLQGAAWDSRRGGCDQALAPEAKLLQASDALEASIRGLKRPRFLHFATHRFAFQRKADSNVADLNFMYRSGVGSFGLRRSGGGVFGPCIALHARRRFLPAGSGSSRDVEAGRASLLLARRRPLDLFPSTDVSTGGANLAASLRLVP